MTELVLIAALPGGWVPGASGRPGGAPHPPQPQNAGPVTTASAAGTPARLCYRCARHQGDRWHWCIRLACDCPCRGRNRVTVATTPASER
jgi:hypothetical protein